MVMNKLEKGQDPTVYRYLYADGVPTKRSSYIAIFLRELRHNRVPSKSLIRRAKKSRKCIYDLINLENRGQTSNNINDLRKEIRRDQGESKRESYITQVLKKKPSDISMTLVFNASQSLNFIFEVANSHGPWHHTDRMVKLRQEVGRDKEIWSDEKYAKRIEV